MAKVKTPEVVKMCRKSDSYIRVSIITAGPDNVTIAILKHINNEANLLLGINELNGRYYYISSADGHAKKRIIDDFDRTIDINTLEFDESCRSRFLLFGVRNGIMEVYHTQGDIACKLFTINTDTEEVIIHDKTV